MDIVTCGYVACGKVIPARIGVGRPAKFCNGTCRQLAYRERKVAANAARGFVSEVASTVLQESAAVVGEQIMGAYDVANMTEATEITLREPDDLLQSVPTAADAVPAILEGGATNGDRAGSLPANA